MAVKLYHGDIVYTPSADTLAVYENSYIAVDSGKVEGIYPVIPEKYKHAECIDYGRQMIIPAFSDLHVHGSQYVQRGIGMDCLLVQLAESITHFRRKPDLKICLMQRSVMMLLWMI